MLTSYLLTTVDKVKKFMNLPSDVGNTNDAILLSMIRQKSNEIENYLNRKIRLQTFTESMIVTGKLINFLTLSTVVNK